MGFFKPFTHHMNLGISGEWVHNGLLSNLIVCGSSLTHLYTFFLTPPPLCCFPALYPGGSWCMISPPVKKNQFKVITATQETPVSFCVLLALLNCDWQMWHRQKLPQLWIFVLPVLLRARSGESESAITKNKDIRIILQCFLSRLGLNCLMQLEPNQAIPSSHKI